MLKGSKVLQQNPSQQIHPLIMDLRLMTPATTRAAQGNLQRDKRQKGEPRWKHRKAQTAIRVGAWQNSFGQLGVTKIDRNTACNSGFISFLVNMHLAIGPVLAWSIIPGTHRTQFRSAIHP
jgi:hypothetical protein